MRGSAVLRSFALVVAVLFAASQAAAQAQAPQMPRPQTPSPQTPSPQTRGPQGSRVVPAALTLPVTGTTSTGGTFAGTLSLQRFAARGNQVLAVGMITGTVTNAARGPVGTFLNGPVVIPVQAKPGTPPPRGAEVGPIDEEEPAAPSAGAGVVQPQPLQECGVLSLDLAPITFNALGLVITTSPITLDLSGETGGTALLGTLVCTILGTLTNVVNLVGLLNQLLGVLGALTAVTG